MGMPYAVVSVFSGEGDPNLPELRNVEPKKSIEYLMERGNMKGKYLGACLDSCRWACVNAVVWPTNIKGLMGIIDRWREENDDNPELYHHRKIDELYKRFLLPHKMHNICPRKKEHSGLIKDSAGRTRCGSKKIEYMKPSFIHECAGAFDMHSQMKTIEIFENEPVDPSYDDEEGTVYPDDYELYLETKKTFDREEPVEVIDVCYAIMNDENTILPFENILERMNLAEKVRRRYCQISPFARCKKDKGDICQGHIVRVEETIFPFDGWDLAFYLQRWKEQGPDAPWFAQKREEWAALNRSKFEFISSDD